MKLTERAAFLIDNLDLPAATGVDDARWEHFQIAHLCDNGTFRIENKARQIAWSFLIAAEAVVDTIINKQSSAFVSINLDEAAEKIYYARAVYDNLQIVDLPPIDKESSLRLEINGARIISMPSKAVRGKARFNVYFDEFAHAARDREIYRGSLPVMTKAGRVRIGSSPMGSTGVFWEIFGESLRKYPGFVRKSTPWWEIYAFCTNPKEARGIAPKLTTEQRVERYAKDRLQAIFANMPLEDFQQEYECDFIDESTSWITWAEIKAAQRAGEGLLCYLAEGRNNIVDETMQAIDRTYDAIMSGKIEQILAAGVDIGRTRNTTEIYCVAKTTTDTYPLRLAITLDACDFDSQLDVLSYTMTKLPIVQMLIDRNGIGRNLAENMEKRYPSKAAGVDFTNETKRAWATNAKMLIQQGKTPLPQDRDIAYQIHSIKRMITASKNLQFDTERNEKHHADKFWAWVLALDASGHGKPKYSKPKAVKYA